MCTFSKQIHSFINAKHKKQIWKYSDLCRWIYICKFRLSRDVNVNIFRHNFSIDFSLGGVTFAGENKFQFGSICLFCQSALPISSLYWGEACLKSNRQRSKVSNLLSNLVTKRHCSLPNLPALQKGRVRKAPIYSIILPLPLPSIDSLFLQVCTFLRRNSNDEVLCLPLLCLSVKYLL